MKTNWTNNVDAWDEVACEALAAELNAKAAGTHLHAQADVTNLTISLSGKANLAHSHVPADITGLATGLAAPTGVAATDTAAIQAAHDALPSTGGEIRLQAGAYYLTAGGLNFTKKVKLTGAGQMDPSAVALTTLFSNSASATGIVSSAQGCVFQDFAIVNGSAGVVPTSGIGLSLTNASNCTVLRLSVHGYFDNIVVAAGQAWTITGPCYIQSPGRYGLRINNSANFDAGDMRVQGNYFLMDGAFANATSAVRWETAGGLRFSDNKIINGATYTWTNGVDLAWNGGGSVDTADMFIHDNSIENINGVGIKLSRTAGSHLVHDTMIKNNQFLNVPIPIQVGAGWDGVEIGGNSVRNCTIGVSLLNGAGIVQVRPNNFWVPVTTACVALATGTAVGTVVAPQNIWGDGVIITSVMDYAQGVPQVDYRYTRSIDWATSSTPVTMWTLGVANAMCGMIDVRVAGFHNNVSGGFVLKRFLYQVANAGGAVTLTPDTDMTHPNTTAAPVISTTTGTNSIAIKLATSDSNTFLGAMAYIDVCGHLTSFKRGP